MASCTHPIHRPFAGMHLVGRTADAMTFQCSRCLAIYAAPVCSASRRSGERCQGVAVTGKATCRFHGANLDRAPA